MCILLLDTTGVERTATTGAHYMSHPQSTEKEVVQRFFDGIDAKEQDVFHEVIAEDITTGIYRSGTDDEVAGADEMQALWQEYWEAFPDLEGVSTELVQEDDRVAVFRREEGTHDGTFRGIEPTGEQITFEYSGYVDIEDGEIVHAYFHGDMLSLLEQLGIESPIPEP